MGGAANRADVIIVLFGILAKIVQCILEKFFMDLFHIEGVIEGADGPLVVLCIGALRKSGYMLTAA